MAMSSTGDSADTYNVPLPSSQDRSRYRASAGAEQTQLTTPLLPVEVQRQDLWKSPVAAI